MEKEEAMSSKPVSAPRCRLAAGSLRGAEEPLHTTRTPRAYHVHTTRIPRAYHVHTTCILEKVLEVLEVLLMCMAVCVCVCVCACVCVVAAAALVVALAAAALAAFQWNYQKISRFLINSSDFCCFLDISGDF